MSNLNSRLFALAIAMVALVGPPALAQGPSQVDSRWVPYVGCWRLVQENVSDQSVPVTDGMIVCVRPSGMAPGSVTMTTMVEGLAMIEQTILADDAPYPATNTDCQGSETSTWSRDGERLFTRVELQCAGRPKRIASGVTLMTLRQSGPIWIDVQAVDVDGDQQVRVRRYQRTSDGANSPILSASLMSIEDVIEANAHIGSTALEAALDEAGGRFALNSRTLRQLADAGVSPNAIDVMVAKSFPERFRVERADTYSPLLPTFSSVGSGTTVIVGSAQYPYPYDDPYYSYYSPFAYSSYWGSNYGYDDRYNNYYYGAPATIVVPGATAQPPSPPGVVVNGRGYTRVRPNQDNGDQSPAQRTPSTRSGARRAGSDSESSDSGSSSGASSGSGSGSSGGAVSGSGYSNGGSSGGSSSGGDSGRTAQPR